MKEPIRILLVEDEFLIAASLVRVLTSAGFEVVGPTGRLSEALALIESEIPIDAAVLDLNLRGEMSFPIADALAAAQTPFVFLTGNGSLVRDGAYEDRPILEKPVNRGALIGMLNDILSEPGSHVTRDTR